MMLKFLDTIRYSEDGHIVKRAHKDEVRYVAHTAAVALINARKAVAV